MKHTNSGYLQSFPSSTSHSISSISSPSSASTPPTPPSSSSDYLGLFSNLPNSLRNVFLGQDTSSVGSTEEENSQKYYSKHLHSSQDHRNYSKNDGNLSNLPDHSSDNRFTNFAVDMKNYTMMENRLENCLSEIDMLRKEIHARDMEIDQLSNSCNPSYAEREKYWTALLDRVTKEHNQQKDSYITENAKLYNDITKLKKTMKEQEQASKNEEIAALRERLVLLTANIANKAEIIDDLVIESSCKDKLIAKLERLTMENEDRVGKAFQDIDNSESYVELCLFAQEDMLSMQVRNAEAKLSLQQSMSNYKAEIEVKLNELRFQNTSLKGEKNSWESKAKSLSRDLSKNLSGNDPLLKEVTSLKARLEQALAERKAFKEAMIAAYSMACRGSKPLKPDIKSEILAELPPSLFEHDGNTTALISANTGLNKLACIGGNNFMPDGRNNKHGAKFTDLAMHIDSSAHKVSNSNSSRGGCFVAFDKKLGDRHDTALKKAGVPQTLHNDSD